MAGFFSNLFTGVSKVSRVREAALIVESRFRIKILPITSPHTRDFYVDMAENYSTIELSLKIFNHTICRKIDDKYNSTDFLRVDLDDQDRFSFQEYVKIASSMLLDDPDFCAHFIGEFIAICKRCDIEFSEIECSLDHINIANQIIESSRRIS